MQVRNYTMTEQDPSLQNWHLTLFFGQAHYSLHLPLNWILFFPSPSIDFPFTFTNRPLEDIPYEFIRYDKARTNHDGEHGVCADWNSCYPVIQERNDKHEDKNWEENREPRLTPELWLSLAGWWFHFLKERYKMLMGRRRLTSSICVMDNWKHFLDHEMEIYTKYALACIDLLPTRGKWAWLTGLRFFKEYAQSTLKKIVRW